MRRLTTVVLASFLLVSAASPARADVGTAFKAYDAKEYERAYTEFRELAELGSALAQVNVGMMLLNGEGVQADRIAGYGWILAASDNESGMAAQLVKELQAKFDPEQTTAARRHVGVYGRSAIRNRLFPASLESAPALPLERAQAEGVQRLTFPDRAREHGTVGSIEVAAILGAEGRVHDAWIMMSIRTGIFDDTVLDAMREWQFKPATVDGKPVAMAFVQQRRFGYLGEDACTRPQVQRFVRDRRAEATAESAGSWPKPHRRVIRPRSSSSDCARSGMNRDARVSRAPRGWGCSPKPPSQVMPSPSSSWDCSCWPKGQPPMRKRRPGWKQARAPDTRMRPSTSRRFSRLHRRP